MNRELVDNILEVVKHATDKRVVLKGLVKLRTDLVKDHAGIKLFFDAGGVSPMVKFLTKPYEQIIEVALSILGNCCTEAACVKEALQCKVSKHLLGILKCLNNEIIQMRALRLLGNLAKNDCAQLLANFNLLNFASDLCNILANSKNVHVLISGFRACRILLKHTPFLNAFLQSEGFILALNTLNKVLDKQEASVNNESIVLDATKTATKQRAQKPHNHVHREEYFIEVMRNLDMRHDICDEYKETQMLQRPVTAKLFALPEDKLLLEQLNEVLKCLQILSYCQLSNSWKNHARKIPNIMWESSSTPEIDLKPLNYLISTESQRSVCLSIVAQLTKCCYAICWLGQAGAVKTICELLVSDGNLTYQDRLNCINALSNLSNDACNRSKIRRSGVLKKLISIMHKNSNSSSETSAILYVLNNFQYDNMGLTLMLSDGLIPTLIKELNEIMNNDDCHARERREVKLVAAKKRKLTEEYIDYAIKLTKFYDGESPSSSPKASMSPCSSRSISPAFSSGFPVEENAEDDESYSPVCSDDEDDQDDKNADSNKIAATAIYIDSINPILKMLDTEQRTETIDEPVSDREDEGIDEIMEETAKDESKTRTNNSQMHCNNINRIEMLIFRSTLFPTKHQELGSPDTMNAIIKAINLFGPTNHFCAALTNILMQKKFFEQILLQGIPHKLYQMTLVQKISAVGYKFLHTLTTVGESNYGTSELVRLLNSKDASFQERAAISIAYIIKAPRILNTFLKHSNMLNFLFKIVLNDLKLNAEAVDAITCMARNSLDITLPTDVENTEEYEIFQDDCVLHENCDMRFVLHTNENSTRPEAEGGNIIVGFNKKVLCEASDVFDAMLNSDFREGHDGEIHLYSYTRNGLRYFLNLIMRNSEGLVINAPTLQKNYTLLEALEMSRVYIMPDLEKSIYELLSMRLNQSNCLSVLTWSIKNHHVQLNDMAVNYYLCANLSSEAKIALYREARNSDLSAEWEALLRDALVTRCSYRYDLILK